MSGQLIAKLTRFRRTRERYEFADIRIDGQNRDGPQRLLQCGLQPCRKSWMAPPAGGAWYAARCAITAPSTTKVVDVEVRRRPLASEHSGLEFGHFGHHRVVPGWVEGQFDIGF